MSEYLELRDIRKEFGSFVALKGVSLAVHPGELICFLGPSGCGKTTLLRIIAGLEVQTSGTVIQAGKDISRLPPMKRDYGIVFQSYALFPNLSIAENVAYGLVNRGMPRAQRDARVTELLALVGLPDSGAKFPAQLSGGQQQRIAIARAIATSPGLLLLDEPLSALDARVRVRLRGEIRSLQQRLGITTILVTHDQEEALSMADRIVVMNQGSIDQIGTPAEVYGDSHTPFVADFVGKTNLLPATCAGGNRVQVGAQRFECEVDGRHANGAGLRVFFRPEDVLVRGVGGATPNSAAAVVEKVEFLGAYSRLTFRMNGIEQPLFADLSVNDLAEFHVKAGDTLRVAVPPERMRVFEAAWGVMGAIVIQPVAPGAVGPGLRLRVHWTDRVGNALLLAAGIGLAVFLLAPIVMILAKSVEDKAGAFVGFANFDTYFHTPSLAKSIWNSVWVSTLVTAITIPLAFTFAYALTRSCMRFKALLRNIALVPILAPSLLAAISFIFWFGNQGLLKAWLGGSQIYGAPGIVISMVFATFPHALMILVTALSLTDARLYEAADALGTSAWRKFWTITLPGAKYGLISAWMVVFTYALSDFGIPKVIGGNFNMLATDIFKLVIGQQDFPKGAVVAIILLVPVAVTYVVDGYVQKRQQALLSARSVPYVPKPSPAYDWAMTAFCWALAVLMLAVLGMAIYGSFVKLWPYNFSLVLDHYRLGLIDAGVIVSWWNSVTMAFWCATLGAVFIFVTAYLIEKTRGIDAFRPFVRLMAVLPMGVPGMVLGLGYIFFFVQAGNPLHFLYGSMAILVICTTVHYYTSSHLTAVTALKQIDNEFEAVSASLRVPFWRTFFKVTVPVCLPAMLEISRYLFVNAMTTVSAVVFLYSPKTTLASVAIVNLDEAGDIGPAAAMASLVVVTSAAVCVIYYFLQVWLDRRTQAWRA